MSAELDLSQYLDLFLQEAEEQIEILESETLKLESEPTAERMQTIFRAAHTLKGSSRAMGFAHMAELTHEMENVLDRLRNGDLVVTTRIADALLNCQDTLGRMVQSIAAGNGDAVNVQSLVAELQEIQGAKTESAAEVTHFVVPEELRAALQEAEGQAPVRVLTVRLTADCVMKFARAFMVTSAIAEGGELLATLPSAEALEEEQFEQEFVCFFQHPQGDEELLANLASVSEVDKFTLVPLAEFNPAPPKPAAAAPVKVADAPPAPTEQGSRSGSQTVRVDVSRLDALMNLIGELVIDRTRIAQIGSELAAKYDDANVDDLNETVGHIARISFDLQDQIMKARMLPIETVFNRFPRVIRDLANKLGKDVAFEMEGGDTELDRSVIEVIGDPLLHILRNSVDHGLEMPEDRLAAGKPVQGHVKVQARHEENHIVIEITDDGRGIDADKLRRKAVEKGLVSAEQAEKLSDRDALNFIFASGFSTAAEVSEVSGRGVGMDIVRSNIQKLGGLIDLDTELGQGTRFSLRLPLTLAIIRGLLVNVGAQVFVLPLGSVVETLLIQEDAIQSINRNEVIVLRGQTLPMVRMDEVFGMPAKPGADAEGQYVVVVGLAEKRMALAVDGLVGEKEVVIKSLSRFCGDVSGISGATILGDGNVALIIDVNGIVLQQSA